MVDAYNEISRTEGALRDLVRIVLGDGWIARSGLSEEAVATMERRRTEDHKRRRGARVGGDLLDYTELTQLGRIILRNWEDFHPALGPHKKNVEMDLDRLGAIRNPVAHTRPLLPYEEHLVAGIGGELRNRIALFRSSMDEADQIWPTLEYVRDNFGNEVQSTNGMLPTDVTLRVGDVVEFKCAATDPEGMPLTWRVFNPASGPIPNSAVVGDDVTLTWVPRESDIGDDSQVTVRVSARDRSHHRHATCDGIAHFWYRVLPAG